LRKFGDQKAYLYLNILKDNPGVISLWGIADARKSTLVRSLYYAKMLRSEVSLESRYKVHRRVHRDNTAKFSWVHVSHPFSLRHFSCDLLLDFLVDDIRSRKAAAVSMMEGEDPIYGCRRFLHENECFVVISGLQSVREWDLIEHAFLSIPIQGSIVVITQDETLAAHCVDHEGDRMIRVINEPDPPLGIPVKVC
jgi:hypothetical protein